MRIRVPVAPGDMLEEAFLKPLGLTKARIAKDIGVLPQRIGDIVAGKRAITADTDAERQFLDRLAAQLELDDAARRDVHAQLGFD